MKQTGAEADINFFEKTVIKERIPKTYRDSTLDKELRSSRTKREAKILSKAPVRVPKLISIKDSSIELERIYGERLRDKLNQNSLQKYAISLGKIILTLHSANIVHGDLTTSNILVEDKTDELVLIDFGLSQFSRRIEDKAVDLHVLRETLNGSHPQIAEEFWKSFTKEYTDEKVLERLVKVEKRGRYKAKKPL